MFFLFGLLAKDGFWVLMAFGMNGVERGGLCLLSATMSMSHCCIAPAFEMGSTSVNKKPIGFGNIPTRSKVISTTKLLPEILPVVFDEALDSIDV